MQTKDFKCYLKNIFKYPMTIIFIVIVLFYGTVAIGKDAEIDTYAVVTAIGLDKAENEEIELSLLTFIPIVAQDFTEKYEVIKAKGQSIAEAMDFAGLHIGRHVGLSHVKTLVINESYFEHDASVELDYLARNKNLALSTSIICTDAKASDFLEAIKTLDSASSIKVDTLIEYNNSYIYSKESTIETFYKGLYSPSKSGFVSFISLVPEDEDGVSIATSTSSAGQTGSGASNAGGESKSAQSENKKILNNGETILCKDATKLVKLDNEQMKNINFLDGSFNSGSIVIEDFSDDLFKNARLTFEIFDNKRNIKASFENGIPIIYIDLKIYVKLSEAKEADLEIKENVDFKNISQEAIKALEFKVKDSLKEGLDILRENKCDTIEIYKILNNTDHKETKKFMESLEDKEDYLNHVIFKVSPQIFSNWLD